MAQEHSSEELDKQCRSAYSAHRSAVQQLAAQFAEMRSSSEQEALMYVVQSIIQTVANGHFAPFEMVIRFVKQNYLAGAKAALGSNPDLVHVCVAGASAMDDILDQILKSTPAMIKLMKEAAVPLEEVWGAERNPLQDNFEEQHPLHHGAPPEGYVAAPGSEEKS